MTKPLLASLLLASLVVGAAPASAAVDIDEDGYRLYCGYLDALEKPDVQKLGESARTKRIAASAKVKPAILLAAVGKGEKIGATCDEVGKTASASVERALRDALASRIEVFSLDYSDPGHVVALVSWVGKDKKKLVEEASLIASIIATEAPLVKTTAIRAVDPDAKDRKSDEAMWFEAKISHSNASRIVPSNIADYAETRYLRLFDGVVRK